MIYIFFIDKARGGGYNFFRICWYSLFKKWKKDNRILPMIISTTVIDQAVAKTHRGRIVNLLENDGRNNVIGVFGDRHRLSL